MEENYELEEELVLWAKIRCTCGRTTKYIALGEKQICECGREVWFELQFHDEHMRPFVSTDPWDAPLNYTKPHIVDAMWAVRG